MESSFTVQNVEFFHCTKWRVLLLYKIESSFTVQNGEKVEKEKGENHRKRGGEEERIRA